MTNSLIPLQRRALSQPSGTSRQLVSKTAPPPVVQSGIRNVLIAFPAGPSSHADDRMQLMRIYAGACEGFEVGVVDYVLQHLVYNNPRNPFPPTPQDVRELCQTTSVNVTFVAIRRRLFVDFWLWEPGELPGDLTPNEADRFYRWKPEWGSPPGSPDCIISEATIIEGVRNQLSRHEKALISLPQQRFAAIPETVFPEGYRDQIVVKREQHAYERNLPQDEKIARWRVISSAEKDSRALTEPEIRELTAQRVLLMARLRAEELALLD